MHLPYRGRRDGGLLDTPEQLLYRISEFGFDTFLHLRPRYGLNVVLQVPELVKHGGGHDVGPSGEHLPYLDVDGTQAFERSTNTDRRLHVLLV